MIGFMPDYPQCHLRLARFRGVNKSEFLDQRQIEGHASRPRNPIIAQVFYLRGMIERWGRGTQKIVELCVKAGHPEPEFGEQAGSVWVRFLPSGYIAPHRVAHDLTERQRELLQILAQQGTAPLREIRKRLSAPPSDRMIQEDLAHLRRLGMVQSSGRGRGALYRLQSSE